MSHEVAMSDNTSGCNADGPMPEVTFSTFIISLASSALVHLGEVPNPETGGTETSLPLAKHSIDVLEMLRAKTENGLEEQERKLLESILYELRMKFVIKCGPDCACQSKKAWGTTGRHGKAQDLCHLPRGPVTTIDHTVSKDQRHEDNQCGSGGYYRLCGHGTDAASRKPPFHAPCHGLFAG